MNFKQFLIVGATLLISSYTSHAIVGFGGYGGIELSTSDTTSGQVFDTTISYQGHDANANVNVETTKIKNPIVFGGNIYVEIPIIPITVDLSGGVSFAKYDAKYMINVTGSNSPVVQTIPNMSFGSSNFLATIKYHFINPPIVKPYLAAGIGSQFVAPLASDENIYAGKNGRKLIEEIAGNSPDPIEIAKTVGDIVNDLKIESRMIYNIGIGTMAKLPLIPVALHVDYRYNFTGENKNLSYMSKTFQTITASLGLNF